MATKKITFDPTAGVPVSSNLTIYGGSNFDATFTVVDTGNTAYGFTTAWSASAQLQKSAGVAATTVPTATFTAGIDTGKITLALSATNTQPIPEGRYLYNVLISSGIGQTVFNIINGNIQVFSGISSTP
jgi:hypothetical protein|tara:strand:+ start:376 stop:762 length:387 start_codon:yes stop_codon:yes gene_type:complete